VQSDGAIGLALVVRLIRADFGIHLDLLERGCGPIHALIDTSIAGSMQTPHLGRRQDRTRPQRSMDGTGVRLTSPNDNSP
jgi:hypothetical protein